MYKIIGSVIIILICVFFGISRCRLLSNRCVLLKELKKCCILLKSEISLKSTPLKKAFLTIGKMRNNRCFKHCGESIGTMSSAEAWDSAVKSECDILDKDTINSLLFLAVGLGKCDKENQVSSIGNFITILDNLITDAENEAKDKSRLILNCSVMLGITAVIILI